MKKDKKNIDHIWSPWRMKYIGRMKKDKGCIFCSAVSKEDGVDNLIVIRGGKAFVILNRYPYTSGHVMVVPYAHASALDELDNATLMETMALIKQSIAAINAVYKPEGFNVGANLGAVAGAGIANHVHFHVVPRWGGDTNFMTSVGSTRVLPEDLCDTYQRLKDAWTKG
ncbi:MAG TPA: HIT domain-containing protein [Pelolinea sp.]|nr:HIT domain-containing protein [Pelolinea sp.]